MTALSDEDAALQARARDDLHQAATEAWQALARRQPAPDLDPDELFQALHLLFAPGYRAIAGGVHFVPRKLSGWA
jgi:hypothetical protein